VENIATLSLAMFVCHRTVRDMHEGDLWNRECSTVTRDVGRVRKCPPRFMTGSRGEQLNSREFRATFATFHCHLKSKDFHKAVIT
jgi:hypothetical protein